MRSTPFTLGLALILLGSSCVSARLHDRSAIVSADASLIAVSEFAPEHQEACAALGEEICEYSNNPFESRQKRCGAEVADQARELGANYVRVSFEKSRVGGLTTAGPVATFYKCELLLGP